MAKMEKQQRYSGRTSWAMSSKNWPYMLWVIVAGIVLVHRIVAWKDLEFGDETTYLGSGLTFSIPFAGGVQWGPLYAAWYAFWHLFIPDTLDLYYFNWALLSVLAGVAVFAFLRSLGSHALFSAWIAVLFLFSNQNLPLNPKISIAPFCLILGVLALIHASSWPQWSRFLAVAFVGLLCAYIRPEFYISFLVASVMGLFFIWKQRAQTHARFISIVTSWLSGVVLLHALFGNPLMGGDDRSVVAFQQHFVTNYYYHWTNEPEPKTIEAQIQLFHRVLGNDVHSFKDALLKQPAWAFKHLWTNIVHTFTANLANFIDTFYQTLFRGWYSNGRFMVGLIVLGLMLSLLDYRATWRQLRQKNWDVWGLVALLALLLPSLIATVLVYPRTHYLVFHLVLILWGLAFVSNRLVFRQIALPYINAQTVGFVVLGLYIFSRVPLYRQELPTPHADNVRYITSLKPNTRLVVLERYWYRVFLKEESTWIHVEEYTDGDFARFVQTKGVNFILMTQDMRDYFAQDTGFADFSRRASDLGFVKLRTNTSGDYLWVKRDVL